MGILSWIIVGLIAGFLAGQVMRGGGYGVIGDIIIGVLGGLLGGWIAFYFFNIGDTMSGISVVSILVAFAGAILLIIILRMIGGRGRYRRNDE
jgi:uncharacterized membrane protein YeaQ/YmgE (transglycosylase-associated protein family)